MMIDQRLCSSMTMRHIGLSHRVLAAVLALAVLVVHAIAGSPALHRAVHKSPNAPDHHCLISLFASGHVDATPVEVLVRQPLSIDTADVHFTLLSASIPEHLLPAGRAPPEVFSS